MKAGIHPEYVEAHVRCTCGNEFTTRSTKPELHVEICSNCHPFYTGRQKLVDTGGRVERFQRRHRVLRVPVIRGVVALVESLRIGFTALNISANAQLPPGEDGEKEEISSGTWMGTVIVAIGLAVGLFFLVPVGITSTFKGSL